MSQTLTLIGSRNEFHAALRTGFQQAAALGCRELWLCDVDFADWPLGERDVIASLNAWAGAQRQLTVLAQNFDAVVRGHARWVEWRRHWSHRVRCYSNLELEAAQLPTLLLASGELRVQLQDPIHYRGSLSRDPADLLRCRETIDAVLQRSADAFPVTTIGL